MSEDYKQDILSIRAAKGPEGALSGKYRYADLEQILKGIHQTGELQDLKPHHFPGTLNLWTTEGTIHIERGRKVTQELIEQMCAQNNWYTPQGQPDYTKIIANIRQHHFRKNKIKYNAKAWGMLQHLYRSSHIEAVIDYLQTHTDRKVREQFTELQPYHFGGHTQRNTWITKAREKNYQLARKALRELITTMMTRYNWSEEETLDNIRATHLREEPLAYGATLTGMFKHIYENSVSAAIEDYRTNCMKQKTPEIMAQKIQL